MGHRRVSCRVPRPHTVVGTRQTTLYSRDALAAEWFAQFVRGSMIVVIDGFERYSAGCPPTLKSSISGRSRGRTRVMGDSSQVSGQALAITLQSGDGMSNPTPSHRNRSSVRRSRRWQLGAEAPHVGRLALERCSDGVALGSRSRGPSPTLSRALDYRFVYWTPCAARLVLVEGVPEARGALEGATVGCSV